MKMKKICYYLGVISPPSGEIATTWGGINQCHEREVLRKRELEKYIKNVREKENR
jgi:hypothetical protein